jgi:hypothetical protein
LPTTRTFVSEDRCTMVTIWPSGSMHVATRPLPGATWGPPVTVVEEKWSK